MGFVTLIIYQINKIEKEVSLLEEKYKRAEELIDMKADIKTLKSKIIKR
ncbi:MAG: hypothetical protein AABX88_02075 [Nanoarchaeota archaeon]